MKKHLLHILIISLISIHTSVVLSSEVQHITLRSSYTDLTLAQVQSMDNISIIKKNKMGFTGHSTIKHSYESKVIKGDEVVIDHATDLMWCQSGSDREMDRLKAQEWINILNIKAMKMKEKGNDAVYSDWRLPTLEEAASLLESSQLNEGLHVDPVFNNTQGYIWTGDNKSEGVAWGVSFDGNHGSVGWNFVYDNYYVRPVRSLK